MNLLHSTIDQLRDRLTPISNTSTFRTSGQVTPEEFVLAGDYLVYKFPTWSWAGASSAGRSVTYLPPGKQFLVTRGVPCARRLKEGFAGPAGETETIVRDGLGSDSPNDKGAEEDGWLQTGWTQSSSLPKPSSGEVRTLEEGDELGETISTEIEDDDIPDIDDDEDDAEAIIHDNSGRNKDNPSGLRSYNLYITYTPYYRTPRLYLSGSISSIRGPQPLEPFKMMEDIVGDYADKTVTLEDFPFHEIGVKMASIHPCKHANVMKVLLDRADAALKLRLEKMRKSQASATASPQNLGIEDQLSRAKLTEANGVEKGTIAAGAGDEWEMLQGGLPEDEVAIRIDQYLVVFIKFMASVTPGMNYDFTMGL